MCELRMCGKLDGTADIRLGAQTMLSSHWQSNAVLCIRYAVRRRMSRRGALRLQTPPYRLGWE